MHNQDTIVALSTPSGVGALGLVRLSGPDAVEIVNRVFSKDISAARGYSLHYGQVLQDGKVLDDVVASVFRGPKSFTREDTVEISFHGSPYILHQAIDLLTESGARLANPGEFTQRAFLNGGLDLAQAEAVADLIASSSKAAHDLAINQLRGGVSKKISELRSELLNFTSLIELELDFGEEDVEFADRDQLLALIHRIHALITQLADSFRLGNAIVQGIPTVIAGRPNAGKSTLLNHLLQEERAIVSEIPGTTRDTIEESLVINGVQFRIIDTAGIREAQDTIEAIGVERTMEKIGRADILVYLFDVENTSVAEAEADLAKLRREGLTIVVAGNKLDRLDHLKENHSQFLSDKLPPGALLVSAKDGRGISELKEQLYQHAIGNARPGEEVIISNVRHYRALEKAGASLTEAAEGIEMGMTQELVALDIRHAIHYLGEITGAIVVDEVLGNIFSKFCIGK